MPMNAIDATRADRDAAHRTPNAPRDQRRYEVRFHFSPRPSFTVRCDCGWESARTSTAGLAESACTAHVEADHPGGGGLDPRGGA
jgi:hypothetical protein